MKIAILTYDEQPEANEDDLDLVKNLKSLLGDENVECFPWSNPKVDWNSYDGVILRSCWDYHERIDEFKKWLSEMEEKEVKLLNSSSLIRSNMHKSYLQDLNEKGAPFLATIFQPSTNEDYNWSSCFDALNTQKIVVKPMISAGSKNTFCIAKPELFKHLKELNGLIQHHDIMIQAYSNILVKQGEVSLIFFDKEFSHAVLKTPEQGDFRTQTEFGASISTYKAPKHIIEQAQRILKFVKDDCVYARVDGIIDGDILHLIELEMIEPSLFFKYAPDPEKAAEKFSQAILKYILPDVDAR